MEKTTDMTQRERQNEGEEKTKKKVKCCSPPLCLIPLHSVLTVAVPPPLFPSAPSLTTYCVELGLHNPLQSEKNAAHHYQRLFLFQGSKDTQHFHEEGIKHL